MMRDIFSRQWNNINRGWIIIRIQRIIIRIQRIKIRIQRIKIRCYNMLRAYGSLTNYDGLISIGWIKIHPYKMGRSSGTIRAVGSEHVVATEFIPLKNESTKSQSSVGTTHVVATDFNPLVNRTTHKL